MEYTTSSAVSSRPLVGDFGCHRTPLRSRKTYVVSLGWLQDSARSPSRTKLPGCTDGPALCLRSRLCVKLETTWVLKATTREGSKCGGVAGAGVRVVSELGRGGRTAGGYSHGPAGAGRRCGSR